MCFAADFDDPVQPYNKQKWLYINNCGLIAFFEDCWTSSPAFYCTDVIYSSFRMRFIYYTFGVKGLLYLL